MILEHNKLLFRTAEILYDEKIAQKAIVSNRFSVVEVLTLQPCNFTVSTTVRTKKTALIDVSQGADNAFLAFNDTARNEIRRTERDTQIIIEHHDNAALDTELYILYSNFQKARGAIPMPRRLFKNLAAITTRTNGSIISAITFYPSTPIVRVRSIFSARHEAKEQRAFVGMATRRLVWELCQWAAKNERTAVDLAGINLTDPAKAGITQFKLSFGSVISDEYTYVYKSFWYILYERVKRFFIP